MLILFLLSISILCPVFIDYSEDVVKNHASMRYKSPDRIYLFGTDKFGRDVFSRVIWGTRIAFYVGGSAVALALLIGVPFGMFCGYWGGWRDEILMRINDAFLCFPGIMLALLIIVALGSNVVNTILAIAVAFIPRISRVIRSCVISLKDEQFVIAAQVRGEHTSHIIFREILPNMLGPIVVEAGVRVSYAIVLAASMSFLGMGSQPPQPAWGLMIHEARHQLFLAPWTLIFPSVALVLLVLSFNYLGDGLRDFFDPKETSSNFFK